MALDGKWNVTLNTPMGARSGVLEISESAGGLSGSWSGPQGVQAFNGGTVNGNEFGWTSKVSGPMGEMELSWKGKQDGDAISGDVQFGSFGSGTFSGKRV